jgi:sporulation protein YlmC with PRC-barrel domain
LQPGQWRASTLIGTRVVSANNETIGDINDVVLDRSGSAQTVVIGVGGFLGIGEKSVGVPFRSLEIGGTRDASTTASTSTGPSSPGGGTTATTGAGGGDVDRIVLRMTKADLEAAPAFQTSGSGSGSGGASGAGGSTAPRQ